MQRYVDVLRDEAGRAVPNAEVRVYIGDSSQLAPLYDGAENPVSQPLTTDANGVIVNGSATGQPLDALGFKAEAGRYRLEAKAAGGSFTRPDILLSDLQGQRTTDLISVMNPTIYPDVPAGIAATADGDYFSTPSLDDGEFLVLYRNSDGSPVEIDRMPNMQLSRETIAAAQDAVDAATQTTQDAAQTAEDRLATAADREAIERQLFTYVEDDDVGVVMQVSETMVFAEGADPLPYIELEITV